MPFGAHETVEVHEILSEKTNFIQHLSLYAQFAQHPEVRALVERHLRDAVQSYNRLAAYTHDYSAAALPYSPLPGFTQAVRPEQIQYGLNQPSPVFPQLQGGLNDQQILNALLSFHKSSAKAHLQAALEIADPNIRQQLLHGSQLCAELAYEIFLLLNRQGIYQVPVLSDQAAKAFLHAYQPVPLPFS